MYHFISVKISLLVIVGLQVSVLVQSTDRGYLSELTVRNGGGWGSWGQRDMCPDAMYAAGFSLKVEDPIEGDDTALNGIRLHCVDMNRHNMHNYVSVQSTVGSWGRWTDIKWCPSGFLTAFQLRVEPSQGNGDDTAANNIMFKCSEGSLTGDGTGWGDWADWSQTCGGRGICGIKTRVEEPQEQGDDTALNDVVMYCCDDSFAYDYFVGIH